MLHLDNLRASRSAMTEVNQLRAKQMLHNTLLSQSSCAPQNLQAQVKRCIQKSDNYLALKKALSLLPLEKKMKSTLEKCFAALKAEQDNNIGYGDLVYDFAHVGITCKKYEFQGNSSSILIHGDIVVISEVMKLIKEKQLAEAHPYETEVIIEAHQRLIFDEDIKLPGVSLLCRAQTAAFVNYVSIDVSGKDGKRGEKHLENAPKAYIKDGANGEPGEAGGHGGNILFQFFRADEFANKCVLSINGGRGGNAMPGQDGEPGNDNIPGKDACPAEALEKTKSDLHVVKSDANIIKGGEGIRVDHDRGGDGGDAGNPGKGGQPGRACVLIDGRVILDSDNLSSYPELQECIRHGVGQPGVRASGGKGACGGLAPRDGKCAAVSWPRFNFSANRYKVVLGHFKHGCAKEDILFFSRQYKTIEMIEIEKECDQEENALAEQGQDGAESPSLAEQTHQASFMHYLINVFDDIDEADENNQIIFLSHSDVVEKTVSCEIEQALFDIQTLVDTELHDSVATNHTARVQAPVRDARQVDNNVTQAQLQSYHLDSYFPVNAMKSSLPSECGVPVVFTKSSQRDDDEVVRNRNVEYNSPLITTGSAEIYENYNARYVGVQKKLKKINKSMNSKEDFVSHDALIECLSILLDIKYEIYLTLSNTADVQSRIDVTVKRSMEMLHEQLQKKIATQQASFLKIEGEISRGLDSLFTEMRDKMLVLGGGEHDFEFEEMTLRYQLERKMQDLFDSGEDLLGEQRKAIIRKLRAKVIRKKSKDKLERSVSWYLSENTITEICAQLSIDIKKRALGGVEESSHRSLFELLKDIFKKICPPTNVNISEENLAILIKIKNNVVLPYHYQNGLLDTLLNYLPGPSRETVNPCHSRLAEIHEALRSQLTALNQVNIAESYLKLSYKKQNAVMRKREYYELCSKKVEQRLDQLIDGTPQWLFSAREDCFIKFERESINMFFQGLFRSDITYDEPQLQLLCENLSIHRNPKEMSCDINENNFKQLFVDTIQRSIIGESDDKALWAVVEQAYLLMVFAHSSTHGVEGAASYTTRLFNSAVKKWQSALCEKWHNKKLGLLLGMIFHQSEKLKTLSEESIDALNHYRCLMGNINDYTCHIVDDVAHDEFQAYFSFLSEYEKQAVSSSGLDVFLRKHTQGSDELTPFSWCENLPMELPYDVMLLFMLSYNAVFLFLQVMSHRSSVNDDDEIKLSSDNLLNQKFFDYSNEIINVNTQLSGYEIERQCKFISSYVACMSIESQQALSMMVSCVSQLVDRFEHYGNSVYLDELNKTVKTKIMQFECHSQSKTSYEDDMLYTEDEAVLLQDLMPVLTVQELMSLLQVSKKLTVEENRIFTVYFHLRAHKILEPLGVQSNATLSTHFFTCPYKIFNQRQVDVIVATFSVLLGEIFATFLKPIIGDTQSLAEVLEMLENFPPDEWDGGLIEHALDCYSLLITKKNSDFSRFQTHLDKSAFRKFFVHMKSIDYNREMIKDVQEQVSHCDDERLLAEFSLITKFKYQYQRFCTIMSEQERMLDGLWVVSTLAQNTQPLAYIAATLEIYVSLNDLQQAKALVHSRPADQWLTILRAKAAVDEVERFHKMCPDITLAQKQRLLKLVKAVSCDVNKTKLLYLKVSQEANKKIHERLNASKFVNTLCTVLRRPINQVQFQELSQESISYWASYALTMQIDGAHTDIDDYSQYRSQFLFSLRTLFERYPNDLIHRFVKEMSKYCGERQYLQHSLNFLSGVLRQTFFINESLLAQLKSTPIVDWCQTAIQYQTLKSTAERDANVLFLYLETIGFSLPEQQRMLASLDLIKKYTLPQALQSELSEINILENALASMTVPDQYMPVMSPTLSQTTSSTASRVPKLKSWAEADFQFWAKVIASKDARWREKHKLSILSVIGQAIELFTKRQSKDGQGHYPRDNQWLSCLLFINADSNKSGRLGEIRTGNGKTLIIAMLALYECLMDPQAKADIFTSSPSLAIRDAEELAWLFGLFDLTVANNCDEKATNELSSRKARYAANVVYGDLDSFQRDLLLTERKDLDLLSERKTSVRIIDEVDSMFLDNAEKVLYLSHDIKALWHLRKLYVQIWTCVNAIDADELKFDELVEKSRRAVKKMQQQNSLTWPAELDDFVERRFVLWVKNARKAKLMSLSDAYVLAQRESDHQENVIIVDKDTGNEQDCSHWSDGLHQFIELKHTNAISKESLKAVFISAYSYFKEYQGKVYGLSGTLGTVADQQMLQDVYHVDLFKLPSFIESKFHLKPATVIYDDSNNKREQHWLEAILKEYDSVMGSKGSVLIVCETVYEAQLIDKFFKQNGKGNHHLYISRYKNLSLGTSDKPMQVGDGIIATNLASRGKDIRLCPELTGDDCPGLHIIATYLPRSRRIDEQILGRAGRNGEAGSGRFIVRAKEDLTFFELQQKRDDAERVHNHHIRKDRLPAITFEHELSKRFAAYCTQFKESIKVDFNRVVSSHLHLKQRDCDAYVKIQIKSIEDAWAFWLDEHKSQFDHFNEHKKNSLNDSFDAFIECLQTQVKSPSLIMCVTSIYELMVLGRFFHSINKKELSHLCFIRAKEKDPRYGYIAAYNELPIYYRGKKFKEISDRKAFKKALKLSANGFELGGLEYLTADESLKLIAKAREIVTQRSEKNTFQKQAKQFTSVFNAHISAINKIIGQGVHDSTFYENKTVETLAQSQKIYRFLLEEEVLRPPRVHKTNWATFHVPPELEYAKSQLAEKLKEAFKNKERIVHPECFGDCFIGQDDLWEKLVEVKLLECINQEKQNAWRLSLHYDVTSDDIILPKSIMPYKAILMKLAAAGEKYELTKHSESHFTLTLSSSEDLPMPKKVDDAKLFWWRYCLSKRVIKPAKVNISYEMSIKGHVEKFLQQSSKKCEKFINNNREDFQFEDDKKQENLLLSIIALLEQSAGSLKSIKEFTATTKQLFEVVDVSIYYPTIMEASHSWLNDVIDLEEVLPWLLPEVLCLGLFALGELVVGVALAIVTAGILFKLSMILIRESINDFSYAIISQVNGHFDLNHYLLYKGISLAFSIVTLGLSCVDVVQRGSVLFAMKDHIISGLPDVLRDVAEFIAENVAFRIGGSALRFIVATLLKRVNKAIMEKFHDEVIALFSTPGMNDKIGQIKKALQAVYENHDDHSLADKQIKTLFEKIISTNSKSEHFNTIVFFSALESSPLLIQKIIGNLNDPSLNALLSTTVIASEIALGALRAKIDFSRAGASVSAVYSEFEKQCRYLKIQQIEADKASTSAKKSNDEIASHVDKLVNDLHTNLVSKTKRQLEQHTTNRFVNGAMQIACKATQALTAFCIHEQNEAHQVSAANHHFTSQARTNFIGAIKSMIHHTTKSGENEVGVDEVDTILGEPSEAMVTNDEIVIIGNGISASFSDLQSYVPANEFNVYETHSGARRLFFKHAQQPHHRTHHDALAVSHHRNHAHHHAGDSYHQHDHTTKNTAASDHTLQDELLNPDDLSIAGFKFIGELITASHQKAMQEKLKPQINLLTKKFAKTQLLARTQRAKKRALNDFAIKVVQTVKQALAKVYDESYHQCVRSIKMLIHEAANEINQACMGLSERQGYKQVVFDQYEKIKQQHWYCKTGDNVSISAISIDFQEVLRENVIYLNKQEEKINALQHEKVRDLIAASLEKINHVIIKKGTILRAQVDLTSPHFVPDEKLLKSLGVDIGGLSESIQQMRAMQKQPMKKDAEMMGRIGFFNGRSRLMSTTMSTRSIADVTSTFIKQKANEVITDEETKALAHELSALSSFCQSNDAIHKNLIQRIENLSKMVEEDLDGATLQSSGLSKRSAESLLLRQHQMNALRTFKLKKLQLDKNQAASDKQLEKTQKICRLVEEICQQLEAKTEVQKQMQASMDRGDIHFQMPDLNDVGTIHTVQCSQKYCI